MRAVERQPAHDAVVGGAVMLRGRRDVERAHGRAAVVLPDALPGAEEAAPPLRGGGVSAPVAELHEKDEHRTGSHRRDTRLRAEPLGRGRGGDGGGAKATRDRGRPVATHDVHRGDERAGRGRVRIGPVPGGGVLNDRVPLDGLRPVHPLVAEEPRLEGRAVGLPKDEGRVVRGRRVDDGGVRE